jgi:hypothetical protein
LEQRYSEMKRVLLEVSRVNHQDENGGLIPMLSIRGRQHVEMICSTKIHDRVGSPETFEQLAELMSFAEHCAASLSTVR